MTLIKKNLTLILITISLLGIYFRFDVLAQREWLIDEVNQYKSTVGAFKPIWLPLTNGELTCFPGDYVLTYPFVALFNNNKWGASLPHIIATFISFYLLFLIAQRFLVNPLSKILCFIIFAFNRELIFHAFELRPYAILIPFSLGAFYAIARIFDIDRPLTPKQLITTGVLFFLGILYHAYGILIIATFTTFFFLKSIPTHGIFRTSKHIFPFYGILGLCALGPWYWYATGNKTFTLANNLIREINPFEYIPNPLTNLTGTIKSVLANLIGHKLAYPLIILPALALMLRHQQQRLLWGFTLTVVVLPILLICYMDAKVGYWFLQRQFIWITAIFAFYLAWSLDCLLSFKKLSRFIN